MNDRQHFRKDGVPKKGHPTQAAAQVRAEALYRRDGRRVRVYECPVCCMFHIGHRRQPERQAPVWEYEPELGERVVRALVRENQKDPSHRRKIIRKRFTTERQPA
jgi:hypothetical protein